MSAKDYDSDDIITLDLDDGAGYIYNAFQRALEIKNNK